MMRIRKIGSWILIGLISLVAIPPAAIACTTAVISGSATIDGRPLLWKNRDAPHRNNQVVYLTGGRYACTAVVNAGQRKSIWMGVNQVGFCIENSVTRDLAEQGAKGLGNGGFMLEALRSCATVEEFERLLVRTNGSRATNANFGVIDAEGGAVLFETSPSGFQKFDANDPQVAPQGYVVRSNFSFTGSPELALQREQEIAATYSGGRYLRGCRLIDQAISDGGPSLAYLLRHNTRDYADSDGNPILGSINGEFGDLPPQIDTSQTISRRTSVSAAVFHGVRPGEDPLLTTMWVMLGEPAFTIAVPCWAGTASVADPLQGDSTSPLCDAAKSLRDGFYVAQNSVSEDSFVNDSTANDEAEPSAAQPAPPKRLNTSALPTIWAETLPTEDRYLATAADALDRWRDDGFDSAEAYRLHQQMATDALEQLTRLAETLTATP